MSVAKGAYGLQLTGLSPSSAALLNDVGAGWPTITVQHRAEASHHLAEHLDGPQAGLRLPDGSFIVLDAEAHSVTFLTTHVLTDEDIAHPYLAAAAKWFARWHGRQAVHGGAFEVDGEAWVVLGNRGQGKSSTLGYLHLHGYPVLSDDVLVIDSLNALAAPRCIDLRPATAAFLGVADRASAARGQTRHRLLLPPVKPEVPIAGWVSLAWGNEVDVRAVRPADRLALLNRQRLLYETGEDPVGVLDLAQRPAWELRRPGDVAYLPEATERLVAALRG